MMQRVLRFKHHLEPRVFGGERLFVLGGQAPIMIRGRGPALVAPFIDGQRSIGQILDALEGRAPQPEVLFALISLEQQGHLVEQERSLSPSAAAFWEAQGVLAATATERLMNTPVTIHGMSDAGSEPVVEALKNIGVRIEENASLHLIVVDDYLKPSLESFNRRALDERFSWMPFKPTGLEAWFGPIFRSGQGPCWTCLAARLRLNRPVETYLERKTTERDAPMHVAKAVLASVHAASNLMAIALARGIVTDTLDSLHGLRVVDLLCLSSEMHPVVRYPQCPTCGDPDLGTERTRSPVRLSSRPKRFTDDGGHRVSTPSETLARLSAQISPLTGFVASVEADPRHNHPLRPVYTAGYRICPAHNRPSFDDFHRIALGKGRTSEQARTSAVCEVIERHSAVFRGNELRRRARIDELDGYAIRPNELQDFSESQFARREENNARASSDNHRVPLPFDPSVAIDWSPVWSLTHAQRRWVPTAYCYANVPVPPEQRFCYSNSNGHAAGNCLEEAILQAFFELVERDSVSIWWYNRVHRPRVDLGSFAEQYFLKLEAHYQSMGYRVWVLDVTTDLEIPAFVALALREDSGRWCVGFGCHLEARLGVQRALTELNQLFDPAPDGQVPWQAQEIEDTSFLFPAEELPARQRSDFPLMQRDDLRDDVLDCIARAASAGLETLVLDQTRQDVDLCAVKVIVPGLRHFWPRFGPGRLYDVPVSMGLRGRPLCESELNPVLLYL